MAQNAPTSWAAPSATVTTELWYATAETGAGLQQVFGIQSIPSVVTPKEDITYRALESTEEFAVKGVRSFQSIEVETVHYKEQYEAVKAFADSNTELWWFIKLPETLSSVMKWRGSVDIALADVGLDSMVMSTIKIGKSTDVKMIEVLPTI